MTARWKVLVVGLLVFQWVQAAVFWHLMDVIRHQAEGSWLHETAWGPEAMRRVWLVGAGVSLLAFLVLVLDLRGAVERLAAQPPSAPSDPRPPSTR